MPVINHLKIKLTLRKVLYDVEGLPVDLENNPLVQWEGEEFEPPETGLWLSEGYLIVSDQRVSTDMNGAQGIYQVNVFSAIGGGQTDAENLATLVKRAFKPGSINDEEFEVQIAIDRCERNSASTEGGATSPRQDNRWLMIPVSVYWRSYATED